MINILKSIVRPIFYVIYKIRFKNIWELKSYLLKNNKLSGGLASVYNKYFLKRNSFIGITSEIEGEPYFPHGVFGVFISDTAKIGKNAIIYQQVTIGSERLSDSKRQGSPTIGDNVYIGAGAKIIGKVNVGDNCRIGANAVVYKDVPSNSVAVCSETRIIQKENLDNRFIYVSKDGKKRRYDNGKFVEIK